MLVLDRLATSNAEVDATVFIPKEVEYRRIQRTLDDTLEKYRYHLPGLNVSFLDPDVHRQRAEELEFDQLVGVVFEKGDLTEQAVDFIPEKPFSIEASITSALLRLTGSRTKRVYFLTGNRELSTENYKNQSHYGAGKFSQALDSAGFQIEVLNLLSASEIPRDCSMLIILGPQEPLHSREIRAIKTYLDSGGKVVLLLEARNDAGMQGMLRDYGIFFRSDLIADKINNLFQANELSPVLELNEHEINVPLTNKNLYVVFSRASGLEIDESPRESGFLVRLLSTKPGGSWSENGLNPEEGIVWNEGEKRGPFTMAVLTGFPVKTPATLNDAGEESEEITGEEREKWGMMLVAGDSSFVANPNLDTSGNKDFILNSVEFMTSDEALIAVRPRAVRPPIELTSGQAKFVFFIAVLLVPLAVAGFGTAVWFSRR